MSRSLTESLAGAANWFLITPDDEEDLPHVIRALSFSGEGALATMSGETENAIIPNGSLAAGIIHPIEGVTRVLDTGTDATGLVGWY